MIEARNKKKEEICKNYFSERHRVKEQVYPAIEVLSERLNTSKKILENKYEEEKNRKEREISYKVENLQKNAEDYTNKFRNEVKRKEHKVNILKDQYMHLQKVYVENLKSLEMELESYVFRERSIEDRRQKESATFKEDVAILKSRVLEYENYLKRIKELSDKKKEEELKEELARSNERKADMIQVKQEIKKMLGFLKTKNIDS